ncbi:uncharacterized protein LOC143296272 [Babylonia areolata]|uniref:uncharacterized protein LOC143296272 n=1 Tax=Babylonia areolata TaxID=304850 RepID=UPI003FD6867C
MKFLVLVLMGLVVLSAGQDDSQLFEMLEEGSDPRDVDPSKVEEMEKAGTPGSYLEQLLNPRDDLERERASITKSLQKTKRKLPPGYTAALNSNSVMFDNNSNTNEELEDTTTTTMMTTTTSTTTRRSIPQLLSKTVRDYPTALYHCPHRTYLLRWFPVFSGGSLTKVCFVPWASWQAITYARCSGRCKIRNDGPKEWSGRCRPSCYLRRVILARCINLPKGNWTWSWEVRYLPQACRCSTC